MVQNLNDERPNVRLRAAPKPRWRAKASGRPRNKGSSDRRFRGLGCRRDQLAPQRGVALAVRAHLKDAQPFRR
jgi:hypothetical protein